jgi:uncharacterized lipoprotein YehR (DUF1307 family)
MKVIQKYFFFHQAASHVMLHWQCERENTVLYILSFTGIMKYFEEDYKNDNVIHQMAEKYRIY